MDEKFQKNHTIIVDFDILFPVLIKIRLRANGIYSFNVLPAIVGTLMAYSISCVLKNNEIMKKMGAYSMDIYTLWSNSCGIANWLVQNFGYELCDLYKYSNCTRMQHVACFNIYFNNSKKLPFIAIIVGNDIGMGA